MLIPYTARGRGIGRGGFLEDYRTFRADQLANEEESWIIGISQSLIGGSGYFYRDTNKLQFVFVISKKR